MIDLDATTGGAGPARLTGIGEYPGDLATLPIGVPLTFVCWGLGRWSHSRGRMASELRDRNAELRSARDERDATTRELAVRGAELTGERELYAALSVRDERTRIAAALVARSAHAGLDVALRIGGRRDRGCGDWVST